MVPRSRPVYPIGLRLHGRRVLVAGGGAVAARRVEALLEAGAAVRLVSPDVVPALSDRSAAGVLDWVARRVEPADVTGCWLVLACTDDPGANAALAEAAERAGVWCARADDAEASRAWVPARGTAAGVTVAVHGVGDPHLARRARDAAVRAVAALDPPP